LTISNPDHWKEPFYDKGPRYDKIVEMISQINANIGGTPGFHATTHQDGGTDEISVAGLSGLLGDAQTPASHNNSAHSETYKVEGTAPASHNNTYHSETYKVEGTAPASHDNTYHSTNYKVDGSAPEAHKLSHQDGGGDEISVTDLSGILADKQVAQYHSTAHEDGNLDEISVAGLSGLLGDAQTPVSHNNTYHSETYKVEGSAPASHNNTYHSATYKVEGTAPASHNNTYHSETYKVDGTAPASHTHDSHTGTLSANEGGTGQSSFTVGDLFYASSTSAISKLAAGADTLVLTAKGAGVVPVWQSAGSGADNMGNHTASEDLKMAGWDITGGDQAIFAGGDLSYGVGARAVTLTLGTTGTKAGNILLYGAGGVDGWIQATNANLHIDAQTGLYLNHYSGSMIYARTQINFDSVPSDPGGTTVNIGYGSNSFRVFTNYGTFDVGPQNSSYCHIYSSLNFYTNKIWYFNSASYYIGTDGILTFNQIRSGTDPDHRINLYGASDKIYIHAGNTSTDTYLIINAQDNTGNYSPALYPSTTERGMIGYNAAGSSIPFYNIRAKYMSDDDGSLGSYDEHDDLALIDALKVWRKDGKIQRDRDNIPYIDYTTIPEFLKSPAEHGLTKGGRRKYIRPSTMAAFAWGGIKQLHKKHNNLEEHLLEVIEQLNNRIIKLEQN